MGDYSLVEITIGIALFLFTALVLLRAFYVFDMAKTPLSVSLTLVVSLGIGVTVMFSYLSISEGERNRKEADLSVPRELATILDIELTQFKMARVDKETYDYSIEIDDTLYWVGYDYDLGKVDHIVSSDKYLYEREEK